MYQVLLIIHVVISAGLIAFILLQQSKGSGMGSLGGNSSGTLFGSSGSANFMTHTTAILATAFFVTSLALSFIAIADVKAQRAQYLPEQPKAAVNLEVPVVAQPMVDSELAPQAPLEAVQPNDFQVEKNAEVVKLADTPS